MDQVRMLIWEAAVVIGALLRPAAKSIIAAFERDEVEGPASAAKKLSAFFVSAPVYRQANYPTVVTRGNLKCGLRS